MKHTEDQQLNVIARAPFEVYYEGAALAVSANNSVGDFDILPGHADFFSILQPCDIVIRLLDDGAEPIVFHANNGIVTVRDNEVMLFVNI